jgi:hypothetical protein
MASALSVRRGSELSENGKRSGGKSLAVENFHKGVGDESAFGIDRWSYAPGLHCQGRRWTKIAQQSFFSKDVGKAA